MKPMDRRHDRSIEACVIKLEAIQREAVSGESGPDPCPSWYAFIVNSP
jgi:hypothetical protein